MAKTNTKIVLSEVEASSFIECDDVAKELFPQLWKRRIVAVAVIAFLLKVFLAWASPGTQDVETWRQFVTDVRDIGGIAVYHKPYTTTTFFNHPPFMLHFVTALGWIADATGLPVRFYLRLAPSIADLGSAFVLWKLFQSRSLAGAGGAGERRSGNLLPVFSPAAFLLFVGAPASIWISGFHGNTDPIMMFFVLLSVLLLERGQPMWMVGLAFGMSLNIKVASLVFVPVFLLFLQTPRRRIEYSIAVMTAFFCGGLPYLVQDPMFIGHRVFGYSGQHGSWGISRLLHLTPELGVADFFRHFGKPILLSALILFSLWMNYKLKKRRLVLHQRDLLRQLALLILLFFTITPSFAVQYLAWAIPLALALEMSAVVIFYTTSSIHLCLNYVITWNWYSYRAFPSPLLDQIFISSEIMCWISVVILLIGETRRLSREHQSSRAANPVASTA